MKRLAAVLILLPLLMMIDHVQSEGDHTSYLVIAPYPTPGFFYGGGEEGSWKRMNPGKREPWFLRGKYLRILETTRS